MLLNMVAQSAQRPPSRPGSGVLPPINTELDHAGKRYHVQTEDRGTRLAVIVTETFSAGQVVASKKIPYPVVSSPIDLPHRVLEQMREAHKAALKAILREEAPTPPVAFKPARPSERDMARIITGRWDKSSPRLEMRIFLLSPAPVTNAEYEAYLKETGMTPTETWRSEKPGPDKAHEPVIGLSMAEARAYAAWKGCRLPRMSELQAAKKIGAIEKSARDLWEWTELDPGAEPPQGEHPWTIFRIARNADEQAA
jgi:hypothetical protein